jgi:LPPG:FO 2-phospho-L-lactate transferase
MSNFQNRHCLALSGGVGGAKLALGLSHVLPVDQLSIVANTADDFDHMGLTICPDLDTVMYTLSDLASKTLGWGQQDETWEFLEALSRLGGEDWFQLGDRDMATHILRSDLLRKGKTLSEVTAQLCNSLGVKHPIYPMSDDKVSTQVKLKSGKTLSFQHYFVRDRCEPAVSGFQFQGMDQSVPSVGLTEALGRQDLGCILICPSNPFVSVDPILSLPGVQGLIDQSRAPTIAVSPIVAGLAIKGPAAKMMTELGMPQTVLSVAEHYQGRIDALVIDHVDLESKECIEALGLKVLVTNTVMKSLDDRTRLADDCLDFSAKINA